MLKKKIIIIGSGGHAKSCIELINNTKNLKLEAIADIEKNLGKQILDYKVTKSIEQILNYKTFKNILIGIGQIKSPNLRIKIFSQFKNKKNFLLTKVISSKSLVSRYASIGYGTSIFNYVVVNAGVRIGENCIINNQSLIEHDVNIGNNCHISTAVKINGAVNIGSNTFIGSGTIIYNDIDIGNNCVIGAGKIIKKNIKSNTVVR